MTSHSPWPSRDRQSSPAPVLAPGPIARLLILAPLSWLFSGIQWLVRRMDDPLAMKAIVVLIGPVLVLGHGERMINLRRVFGPLGWSRAQRAALSRRCAWHYARVVLDTIRLASMDRAQLVERVTFVGEEHLQAALARKTGVLLIGNHIGNLRVTLAFLGARGYAPSVVAYEVPIASVAAHQEGIWRRYGVSHTPVGAGATGAALRALERGGIFVAESDVCLRAARSAWLRFGHAAINVDTGLSRLALMTRAPIHIVSGHREDDGRYVVTIRPELTRESVGHDPGALAQAWLDDFYEEFLQWPEQWELVALTRLGLPDRVASTHVRA